MKWSQAHPPHGAVGSSGEGMCYRAWGAVDAGTEAPPRREVSWVSKGRAGSGPFKRLTFLSFLEFVIQPVFL